MLTPADEITSNEELVNLADVLARIPEIRPFRVADSRLDANAPPLAAYAAEADAEAYIAAQGENIRPFLIVDEYEDESDELTALRRLADEMTPLGSHASAISEGYLMTFLRDELDGLYGSNVLTTLDSYVDWDRYRDDRAAEMTRTEYRDGVFYLTR